MGFYLPEYFIKEIAKTELFQPAGQYLGVKRSADQLAFKFKIIDKGF